jgi:hypothetical protein
MMMMMMLTHYSDNLLLLDPSGTTGVEVTVKEWVVPGARSVERFFGLPKASISAEPTCVLIASGRSRKREVCGITSWFMGLGQTNRHTDALNV